jgi:hypothetical protein
MCCCTEADKKRINRTVDIQVVAQDRWWLKKREGVVKWKGPLVAVAERRWLSPWEAEQTV